MRSPATISYMSRQDLAYFNSSVGKGHNRQNYATWVWSLHAMGQIVKFNRRRVQPPQRPKRQGRNIPRNVFLPVATALGFLFAFADLPMVTHTPDTETQGPRVLRGGDALNGGRQGLGGFSSSSQRSASSSKAGMLVDRVTRVRDGDTIVVGLIPIRIANLDCAESGTLSGDRATRMAKQLASGTTMTCRLEGRRSYDREVGVCALPDGRDFGEVLISAGVCDRW